MPQLSSRRAPRLPILTALAGALIVAGTASAADKPSPTFPDA